MCCTHLPGERKLHCLYHITKSGALVLRSDHKNYWTRTHSLFLHIHTDIGDGVTREYNLVDLLCLADGDARGRWPRRLPLVNQDPGGDGNSFSKGMELDPLLKICNHTGRQRVSIAFMARTRRGQLCGTADKPLTAECVHKIVEHVGESVLLQGILFRM